MTDFDGYDEKPIIESRPNCGTTGTKPERNTGYHTASNNTNRPSYMQTVSNGNMAVVSRVRRKSDGARKFVAGWMLRNQIGMSIVYPLSLSTPMPISMPRFPSSVGNLGAQHTINTQHFSRHIRRQHCTNMAIQESLSTSLRSSSSRISSPEPDLTLQNSSPYPIATTLPANTPTAAMMFTL